jgi:hypothetical protein
MCLLQYRASEVDMVLRKQTIWPASARLYPPSAGHLVPLPHGRLSSGFLSNIGEGNPTREGSTENEIEDQQDDSRDSEQPAN